MLVWVLYLVIQSPYPLLNILNSKIFQVASREFETEFRRLISRAQPAVASRLRALLRKWAEGEFRSDPQLDLIPALYKQLRIEAGEAPQASASPSGGSSAAAAAAAQREQVLCSCFF